MRCNQGQSKFGQSSKRPLSKIPLDEKVSHMPWASCRMYTYGHAPAAKRPVAPVHQRAYIGWQRISKHRSPVEHCVLRSGSNLHYEVLASSERGVTSALRRPR